MNLSCLKNHWLLSLKNDYWSIIFNVVDSFSVTRLIVSAVIRSLQIGSIKTIMLYNPGSTVNEPNQISAESSWDSHCHYSQPLLNSLLYFHTFDSVWCGCQPVLCLVSGTKTLRPATFLLIRSDAECILACITNADLKSQPIPWIYCELCHIPFAQIRIHCKLSCGCAAV